MLSWFKRHPESTVSLMVAAFPAALEADVRRVMRVVPVARIAPFGRDIGAVLVDGETLHIPYRVYFPEPAARTVLRLTSTQLMILAAIYTRHHDGYVREAFVLRLGGCHAHWIAPFVAQLLGEYVIEIAQSIERAGTFAPGLLREFASANDEFCRLTSAHIQSYWALYYRLPYPVFRDYPVYVMASQLGLWRGHVPRRLQVAR